MSDNETSPEPKRTSKLALAVVFAPILLIGGCAAMIVFPWKSVTPAAQTARTFEVTPAITPEGERWPLTVDRAVVVCGPAYQLMLAVPDTSGTWYYLNGTAKGTHKYADLMQIWKDDPDVKGLKIGMWLTTYGNEKCGNG